MCYENNNDEEAQIGHFVYELFQMSVKPKKFTLLLYPNQSLESLESKEF